MHVFGIINVVMIMQLYLHENYEQANSITENITENNLMHGLFIAKKFLKRKFFQERRFCNLDSSLLIRSHIHSLLQKCG